MFMENLKVLHLSENSAHGNHIQRSNKTNFQDKVFSCMEVGTRRNLLTICTRQQEYVHVKVSQDITSVHSSCLHTKREHRASELSSFHTGFMMRGIEPCSSQSGALQVLDALVNCLPVYGNTCISEEFFHWSSVRCQLPRHAVFFCPDITILKSFVVGILTGWVPPLFWLQFTSWIRWWIMTRSPTVRCVCSRAESQVSQSMASLDPSATPASIHNCKGERAKCVRARCAD